MQSGTNSGQYIAMFYLREREGGGSEQINYTTPLPQALLQMATLAKQGEPDDEEDKRPQMQADIFKCQVESNSVKGSQIRKGARVLKMSLV